MNSIGVLVFFTIVLLTASFTSLTVVGPQQAMAKSPNSVMKSLIANTTKIGFLSIPITCTSIGDIMGALSHVVGNATTAAGGGNKTNSTQGMNNLMKALSGVLGNTTAGGGNGTSSMQGMMTSVMQNMSQLQHSKNFVFCSLANEKTIRSMMK
jgi:hypothetical protein